MSTSLETLAECPSCHATVTLEATECPRCGELFEPDATEPAKAEATEATEAAAASTKSKPGFREKLLFYAGIVLILLGGPGIALGSWLHDVLRISLLNYNAFDVFGGVNRLVMAAGLIVVIVGVVLFILSLRFSRPADDEAEPARPRDA